MSTLAASVTKVSSSGNAGRWDAFILARDSARASNEA